MRVQCGKLARMKIMLAAALAVFATASQAETPTPPPPAEHGCVQAATWYALSDAGPQPVAAEDILRRMSRSAVVLLGEHHDSAPHHIWQLQTLAALQALRPHLVIGFEAFPRRVQPALDDWVAGKLTVKQFLARSEWTRVWNYPPELYLPLFEFARLNRIPMIALNVDRKLTEDVARRGWDAVPTGEKEGVSRPAQPSEAYERTLRHVFDLHRDTGLDKRDPAVTRDQAFRFFVESQSTWDRAMAEALAARTHAAPGEDPPLVVGIMGAGHVTDGYGVPHQLHALGVRSVATLLPIDTHEDCGTLKTGYADAVFAIAATPEEPEPPPRLGIQLGKPHDAIEITGVTAGSLAERTGLRAGDRIVGIAGKPVTGMEQIVRAVRGQPPGTWLPMQIQRGGQTLEVVVHFPPSP